MSLEVPFFLLEATLERVLTIDNLQKRDESRQQVLYVQITIEINEPSTATLLHHEAFMGDGFTLRSERRAKYKEGALR